MPDNSKEIAHLEAVYASGVRNTAVDGTSTTFQSAEELRRAIETLKREDTTGQYSTRRRAQSIDLSGF